MTSSYESARGIFLEHDGILRSSEAQKLGIHPQILARMLDAELLIKEERGLYRLAEVVPKSDPDLVQIAKLVPKAVICLISALGFHGMTTQIPRKVYIALPKDIKKPKIEYPPIEVVWLSRKPYFSGIEQHKLDGVMVPIYDREKTVADCFKFRSKIGEDVAIEALKDYLRSSDRDIDQLLHYAEIDRVRIIMDPYLKALL